LGSSANRIRRLTPEQQLAFPCKTSGSVEHGKHLDGIRKALPCRQSGHARVKIPPQYYSTLITVDIR
jgi:hypothetical protein